MRNVVDLYGVTQARTTPHDRALAAQLLSDRHRKWGRDCPAADIDFINYDQGVPTGLIEYKHELAAPIDLSVASRNSFRPLGVLRTLADQARQPLFICRYSDDLSSFKVQGMNDLAVARLAHRTLFDEAGYVDFLYSLGERKRRIPPHVRVYLKGQGRLDF